MIASRHVLLPRLARPAPQLMQSRRGREGQRGAASFEREPSFIVLLPRTLTCSKRPQYRLQATNGLQAAP